ncbi:MoxR family ATPase [Candidatus Saccharibacteria bacterium]|nr:MoxR family ATPase [Candidatus Saccharibacteria bacterium]
MSEFQPNMSKRIQEFGSDMRYQLNNVVYGEPEAVDATIVGLTSGSEILLAGPPGGSKTELAKALVSSIFGLTIDNIADIPPQSDLSPARLIGGSVKVSKTILRNGQTEIETTETATEGILKPDSTVFVFGDEVNRVNPLAINALLPVLSGRELPSDKGRTPMSNLLNGIFTMNPGERAQATFPLTSAFIGRLGVGAFIGASHTKSHEERAGIISAIAQRNESVNFEALSKLTSVDEIKAIRSYIAQNVVMPSNGATQDYFAKSVIDMTDTLRDMKITNESDGRDAVQLARNAKSLAALGGRELVEAVDVLTAAKMLSTARIAAQSRDAYTQIPQMHQMLENI